MKAANLKTIGIVLAVAGAGLFLWHFAEIVSMDEQTQGAGEHHVWSLIDGVLLLIGIASYFVWQKYIKQLSRD